MRGVPRTRCEHGPQFDQRLNADLGRASHHGRANGGIAHPGRQLARDAGTRFKVEDFPPAPPGALVKPQPLAMQRMPAIHDLNQARSVC